LDVDDNELTDDQLREKYAPIAIGPTWAKNEDGSWALPEHTLGWEIAAWCADWLTPLSPDQEQFTFTLEQLRFILWWYAVDDAGNFVYRNGTFQRLKGHGKDPLLAVICLIEMVGPSRFSHWDEDGNPVGRPCKNAWVQIAATSRDQTKNTSTMFPALISDKMIQHFGFFIGSELIRAQGGRARIEVVTSSPRTLEGGRVTFTVLGEVHQWVEGNQGHKMYEVIQRNATKVKGRYLSITNAYLPGEDSVGQRLREAYDKVAEGKAVDTGVLYDSLEAPPHAPLTPRAIPIVVEMIRGDSVWLDPDFITKAVLDNTISPALSRRFWYNQIVADEDALYSPAQWDVLAADTTLNEGEQIVLGFDGGKTDDATALVAIRTSDHTAFVLGLWERPDGPMGDGWEVPREEVDSAVHAAFRHYKVLGFYADVALWESYIHEWSRVYGDELRVKAEGKSPIGWDMRSQRKATLAHEQLITAVFDGTIHHNGDVRLRRHVLNTRRAENNYGVSFRKESRESPRKVDLYAALMLAYTALRDYEVNGKKVKERTGRGYFF
jgi:hypothetical protein